MPLHINLEDLLSNRSIESDRIEFKEGWNPDAIYRSICAFANDFDNMGGGYIIVGVAEENGIAKRPVKGLTPLELSEIQRKMIGFNNLIRPVYNAKLFIEEVDGQQIMVIWIPGGSNRPYEVPEQITANQKRYFYYVRRYANSVKAEAETQQELISLANQVPFDDRSNVNATLDDVSMVLLQDHLRQIGSKLLDRTEISNKVEVLEQMLLVEGPPEHRFPRNVALMMFNEHPEKFFPTTWVDIVHFPQGEGHSEFTEYPRITGPVPAMIKKTLELLSTNFIKSKTVKKADRAEALHIWNYPYAAIEEVIANALYHRDYQVREQVEVRILQTSIVVLNYGGPDRSIRQVDLYTGRIRPRRYRNRRLGDFLKELNLTEGRATGIPTVKSALELNGSPAASFRTDDNRSFFEVELFIHGAFENEAKNSSNIALGNRDSNREGNRDSNREEEDFQLSERQKKILEFCKTAKSRTEIFEMLAISNQPKNFRSNVQPLIVAGYLIMTEPDKPSSKNQKYLTSSIPVQ